MLKIITFIMLLSFTTPALASGFKGSTSLQYNQETTTITHDNYDPRYPAYSGLQSSYGSSSIGVFGSLGYEQDLSPKFSTDLNLGLNQSLVGRADANIIYQASDKVKIKIGPNISHKLNGESDLSYKPGIGGQIGSEISLNEKSFVKVELAQTNYSYHWDSNHTGTEFKTNSASIGIGFRF